MSFLFSYLSDKRKIPCTCASNFAAIHVNSRSHTSGRGNKKAITLSEQHVIKIAIFPRKKVACHPSNTADGACVRRLNFVNSERFDSVCPAMIRNQFITIKDIASTLGISVSTVSRALRDCYDVSPETREKVLQMAGKLNYKPNLNAQGLVSSQTHNIGIILPFITNYYFSTVITGIQEVAWNNGYNTILYVTNEAPERELSILRNLPFSSLDGLLACISAYSNSAAAFQQIIDRGIPVVFFDRIHRDIHTSKVMQDDYNGAFEAVEHLINNGYTKIAHLSGPTGFPLTTNREQGYRDALAKHDLPIHEEWILHSGFSQEDGERDTGTLFESWEKPDAIFAASDRKAVGAMLALKQIGIRIGEEVGVIGFTNDPVSSIISPGLSTIAEPALEVGSKSCELLIQHITKTNFTPVEIVLPGRLIVRESTLHTARHPRPHFFENANVIPVLSRSQGQ
jgi:LacI family transcriptional regulator